MKQWPKTPDDIAHELQGTCTSLGAILERYEMEGAENDTDFCFALDQQVFECECCGWWFEQSEMTAYDPVGRWICEECGGDEE